MAHMSLSNHGHSLYNWQLDTMVPGGTQAAASEFSTCKFEKNAGHNFFLGLKNAVHNLVGAICNLQLASLISKQICSLKVNWIFNIVQASCPKRHSKSQVQNNRERECG